MRGRPKRVVSEETKAKLSTAMKNRWSNGHNEDPVPKMVAAIDAEIENLQRTRATIIRLVNQRSH
jgi:hypothetical protein